MNVVHFIGSESKGGNVRYAEVAHHCLGDLGLNSFLPRVGQPLTPDVLEEFSKEPTTIFFHATGTLTREQLQEIRESTRYRLVTFAHNPQLPKNCDLFDLVVPVSEYVRKILLDGGIEMRKVYRRPAYLPISILTRDNNHCGPRDPRPVRRSEYDWNQHKPRDFFLRYFDRLGLRPWRHGARLPNPIRFNSPKTRIRLGIVSRLARLKQFPELFGLLHSGLEAVADKVEIHILGSGPWGQVQGLKSKIPKSLRPNVFFWGWQEDPWACVPGIDALVLGMPDKEALGLNILEATMRKIPVIGIDGGPFREVVEPGRNGWLLSRHSIQKDFEEVVANLESRQSPCSFEMSTEYTYRFSERRFYETLEELLNA